MNLTKFLSVFKSLDRRQKLVGAIIFAATVLLLLALGNSFLCNSKPKVEFKPYTSNQGGFTINAPNGIFTISQEKILFMGNKLQQFNYFSELPGITFKVLHFDMPLGIMVPTEQNNILNHLAAEFLNPVQGIISSTSDIELQGHSGVHLKATGMMKGKEMIAEGLIIIVANRIYVAGCYGENGVIRQKDINTFLQSLKFNF